MKEITAVEGWWLPKGMPRACPAQRTIVASSVVIGAESLSCISIMSPPPPILGMLVTKPGLILCNMEAAFYA
ncbi:hypothetical protein HBI56_038270 [Parastagonospora nodorum]|uniref:Uncharacterized protein n=1 Tax=Phaeosphaeria nodorum (strain SN15 / ATCC MYA-4574 / FGSC 10173) TaxID=321614 RepID=A0A7U2EYR2_PHANO|nr:hypothetical protein HBH56_068540 [Parastagonospora nodorum]QRC93515.1 hypothetical protein JI435_403990 [Parastagonospora nodorum SN15]KAH3932526.1 hypothetical protein HBH54_079590 [Parastagonospora nodorum]KAH3954709.1 hypothetical protein HBH53_014780 [Parastagonospora nodorum]KAH3986479.1 hypothetical protein HBH52_045940 [Parastagonospora nodorum]